MKEFPLQYFILDLICNDAVVSIIVCSFLLEKHAFESKNALRVNKAKVHIDSRDSREKSQLILEATTCLIEPKTVVLTIVQQKFAALLLDKINSPKPHAFG